MSSASDPENLTTPARTRLDGWKEIAAYFGRGVRTVQRWERELQLPIHRIGTGRGQVIYALVEELDRWRESAEAKRAASEPGVGNGNGNGDGNRNGNGHAEVDNGRDDSHASSAAEEPACSPDSSSPASAPIPTGHPRNRSRIGAIVTAAVFAVAALSLVGWFWFARSTSAGQPASARVINDALTVFDASGNVLWEHRFDFPLTAEAYAIHMVGRVQQSIVLDDVDGDGSTEVLFVAEPWKHKGLGLFCFNADGTLRFRHVPTGVVTFGAVNYAPPWRGGSVYTSGPAGRSHDIWFVSSHLIEFPTRLEKLDQAGKVRGEYWSNGQIANVVTGEVAGRSLVFVCAISNEFKGGSLAVLDSSHPYGSAPASSADYRCTGCPAGDPLAFLVFPRLDLTAAIGTHSNVSYVFLDRLGQILVGAWHSVGEDAPEELQNNATTEYRLDHQFHVIRAELGERLPSIHAFFERKRLVDHPFSRERDAQFLWPVRRWEGSRFVEITSPEASSPELGSKR